jgi:hypothetical protein
VGRALHYRLIPRPVCSGLEGDVHVVTMLVRISEVHRAECIGDLELQMDMFHSGIDREGGRGTEMVCFNSRNVLEMKQF